MYVGEESDDEHTWKRTTWRTHLKKRGEHDSDGQIMNMDAINLAYTIC